MKKLYREWAPIRDLFKQDYFPLTDYSLAKDSWIAWAYQDYHADRGVLQAFRREASDLNQLTLKLRGLDPKAEYELIDADSGKTVTKTGKALMTEGLAVEITKSPGSALWTYARRVQK